ncbi:hypothetical protein [Natronorubrum sp. DTA7]|uniref:hypothetical protein n=1 Tax=Natronorubrum sp. DTA7 TaxID=3447016 RepID=UPI003F868F49
MSTDETPHETDVETGPVDERWSTNNVVGAALLFGMAAVATPIAAFLEGGMTGAIFVVAPLTVIFGYESRIIPQLKWEIARRIRGE